LKRTATTDLPEGSPIQRLVERVFEKLATVNRLQFGIQLRDQDAGAGLLELLN
jgi:hypothetical protein